MTQKKPRPSLAPKHTRTSEANRDAELDTGVTITVDGEAHTVRVGDLTPQLVRELRRCSGFSFTSLCETLGADPDVDVISTFVWLAQRVAGEQVEHDDVMVGYASILGDDFNVTQAGTRKVDDEDPEG